MTTTVVEYYGKYRRQLDIGESSDNRGSSDSSGTILCLLYDSLYGKVRQKT